MRNHKQIPTVPFFFNYPSYRIIKSYIFKRNKKALLFNLKGFLYYSINYNWRQLTANQRNLPDFLIIGEAKCGTTSLFHYISQSPTVIPPMAKEIHYFDAIFHLNDPLNFPDYSNDKLLKIYKNQYAAFFPRKKEIYNKTGEQKAITGEASPASLRHCGTHKIMKCILPDKTKYIAIFRNPTTRSRSIYYFMNRGKKNICTFDELVSRMRIEDERKKYNTIKTLYSHLAIRDAKVLCQNQSEHLPLILYLPCYAELLRNWYKIFPDKNKLLILSFEEMAKSPQTTLNQVTDFLEIPRFRLTEAKNVKPIAGYDSSKNPPMKKETKEKLAELFLPYNKQFYELVNRDFGWD